MSAHGIVGFARDQNVLTVGGCGRRLGIAHLRGTERSCKFGEDYRHDSLLRERLDNLLGRIREHGRAMLLGFCKAACQRSGQMDGVGIGEEKPFAASSPGSGGYGVIFAGPTCGDRTGIDDSNFSTSK